jgi:hypothetical protein
LDIEQSIAQSRRLAKAKHEEVKNIGIKQQPQQQSLKKKEGALEKKEGELGKKEGALEKKESELRKKEQQLPEGVVGGETMPKVKSEATTPAKIKKQKKKKQQLKHPQFEEVEEEEEAGTKLHERKRTRRKR